MSLLVLLLSILIAGVATWLSGHWSFADMGMTLGIVFGTSQTIYSAILNNLKNANGGTNPDKTL